ncbi:TonB family protein [Sphingomonas sp. 4RDLI-65]|uniref:energy transducer TonB family protein n=1 Tax=Sphingomonas sp. 4RDLI-65 TaxID=3111641 RepID=UPI003C14D0B2
MSVHMTIARPVASPTTDTTVDAMPSGYRQRRWSPLSLGLTLLVQAIPVVIALWVWQPALVQIAPTAPLAVFDVPAPEAPAETVPEDFVEPVEAPSPALSPAPSIATPEVAPTAAPAPTVPVPATIAPTPSAPAAAPPAPTPPPRPVASAPSERPADWQSRVLGRLNAVKSYPSSARARRQQGVVLIRFTLDRAGTVLAVTLEQSSGFALLDREALALPKRASPLPGPPEDVKGQRIELVVPVEFHV